MAYVCSAAADLQAKPMVGNHQCVALVRTYAGAPVTLAWHQGDAVVGNSAVKVGTAIATFVNGRYPNRNHGNHAALYMGDGLGGIYVMDQWKGKKNGIITKRFIKSLGRDKQGNFIRPSNNADAFSVIE
ncbi:BPSL0067 family protein [Pseudoduganella sp. RAF53_2]|uniref:BPSL0067 family protein n=1 Tax=unclassified Pseudoduganella TaxID=2637179 RepID=UPI003F9D00FA